MLGGRHDPADYEQVFDILDVWFDSGSTHAFVLRDRADGTADGIADLYLEGTDQHRGWFHSSMLQACGTMGRAPYRGVVTHGFTLDEKGMKMSKSLGNTVVPQEVIEQYGADILRLWVAQSDYTADQRIGQGDPEGHGRQLSPAAQHAALHAGQPRRASTEAERVAPAEMPELERWVLHRLAELDAEVREGYAAFDFQGVFQQLFNFCTVDLSAFYFDVRKDALYCDAEDSLRRRAARTVLDLLFHRLTTWLAPILVFTMEDVWLSRFPGDDVLGPPAGHPGDAGRLARRERWRRNGTDPPRPPRGDRRAGGAAHGQGDRSLARGRTGRPCRRDADVLAALKSVPFDDLCITSASR